MHLSFLGQITQDTCNEHKNVRLKCKHIHVRISLNDI